MDHFDPFCIAKDLKRSVDSSLSVVPPSFFFELVLGFKRFRVSKLSLVMRFQPGASWYYIERYKLVPGFNCTTSSYQGHPPNHPVAIKMPATGPSLSSSLTADCRFETLLSSRTSSGSFLAMGGTDGCQIGINMEVPCKLSVDSHNEPIGPKIRESKPLPPGWSTSVWQRLFQFEFWWFWSDLKSCLIVFHKWVEKCKTSHQ